MGPGPEVRRRWSEITSNHLDDQLHATDAADGIGIRAPQSGVVHQLAMHTVGGVVDAGEPIMLVVPEGDKLVVEARVAPRDIDQVLRSDQALVRFAAFNPRTTPEVKGHVLSVSADLTQDERSGEPYFVMRIEIPEPELNRLTGNRLVSSMAAEVHIRTFARRSARQCPSSSSPSRTR